VPGLRSEHLLRLSAELEDPLVLAEAPHGTRRILYFRGGEFSGPRLRGQVLAGGGDWVLLRRDGVSELDIRLALRTEDGALIYVACDGIFDIAPEVRERIMKAEPVDPAEYYFRTALRFETGAQAYRWLNRILAVGVGRRTPTGMVTEVFAVR
jgi:hypothetical protein